ncbi:MAG: FeoA family protein [Bacteroidota bacterium]
MNSSVSQLKQGSTGTIANFTDEITAGKLLTMGFLPGSKVKVVRIAPFQGGIYVQVDGSNMALRVKEANSILVTGDW